MARYRRRRAASRELVFNNSRIVYLTVPLVFDRQRAHEDERAVACHAELQSAMAAHGYYSYRYATLGMDHVGETEHEYAATLLRLKQSLDPKGVLAPGRYSPHES